jgi:hypothetical protein
MDLAEVVGAHWFHVFLLILSALYQKLFSFFFPNLFEDKKRKTVRLTMIQWCRPVIPAVQEAEIRRTTI